jgi:hypothetical protein
LFNLAFRVMVRKLTADYCELTHIGACLHRLCVLSS